MVYQVRLFRQSQVAEQLAREATHLVMQRCELRERLVDIRAELAELRLSFPADRRELDLALFQACAGIVCLEAQLLRVLSLVCHVALYEPAEVVGLDEVSELE